MRKCFLASILVIVFIAPLPAQSPRDKVSFQSIRLGFTPGPHANSQDEASLSFRQPLYKPGAWLPVYVDVLNTGKYDQKADGPAEVIVETLDSDDASHSYRVPLPPFDDRNPSVKVMAYTRPGSRYADFIVRVQTLRGKELVTPYRVSHPGMDPSQVLYLALGSRLPGLKLPGAHGTATNPVGNVCEIGLITRVEDMPPHWFGYAAADVVILSTGDRAFATGLLGDNAGRKAALAEWVRRGGKLVVLAGVHADVLTGVGFEEINALLPMDVTGKRYAVSEIRPVWRDFGTSLEPINVGANYQVTRLSPREGRSTRILVDGPGEGGGSPLVVQAAYGLGRVTLVAVDLDQKPFSNWTNQGLFWEQLLKQAGPRVPNAVQVNQFGGRLPGMGGDEGDATLQNLVRGLEAFEGVPVISFGWVALFILLYILVVGPIDYLFLKKVVKRLELTWITFPTVVIAVSAAAYFTAYALKGNDLRINKVDLVDIDLNLKQVFGRAYFSLFSPRIQNYTMTVEPAPGWAAIPDDGSSPNTNVSWFGSPRQGQRSLFRRSYDYEPQATALRGVPIQVWSTKNFQALWQAGFAKDKPPFVGALRHPPGRTEELIGTITNQLPVELLDAVLIYKGEVAALGRLDSDIAKAVSAQNRLRFSSWRDGISLEGGGKDTGTTAPTLQMSLLFHEEMIGNRNDPSNGALRDVDESWRVSPENRDEAIVVVRLAQRTGLAEEVTQGPASASRLWLGELPTSGRPRPPIPGNMRQDTYVRVFIPVAAK